MAVPYPNLVFVREHTTKVANTRLTTCIQLLPRLILRLREEQNTAHFKPLLMYCMYLPLSKKRG